jgi:hypothetical protein
MTAEDQGQVDKDKLVTSAAEAEQGTKEAEGSNLNLYLVIGVVIGFVLAFALARKQRKDKNSKASQPTPSE